jgi:geranylgeranyl pyrophosphate synthase
MNERFLADFTSDKARVRAAVEDMLGKTFAAYPQSAVNDCARHVALGGGHRWRAIVAIAAGRIFDDDAFRIGLPGACAVELAHSASLVLDDLPSMDDAEFRRGKPCAHLAFPRWAVDMAPVFMVTMAYAMSLENERTSTERRVRGALLLSSAAQKMIAGQARDILQDYPAKSPEQHLLDCYELKTGALYSAAAQAGAILCGANDGEADLIAQAGTSLGMSCQLLDDVADVIAGVEEVGKQPGRDAGKWTAIDWLGVEGARRESVEFQEKGLALLEGFGHRADWLRVLLCEVSYART